MARFESGSPYNVTTGFDDNGDTIVNDRPAGTGRNAARGASRFALDLRLGWSKGFGPERPSRGPQAQVIRMGADSEMPADLPGNEANRRFQVALANRIEPLFVRGMVRRAQHGQAIQRPRHPVGRQRVVAESLKDRSGISGREIVFGQLGARERQLEQPR